MNVMIYLAVAPMINDCPNCGNSLVGNGEGTLKIDDDIVERTCKCGFDFTYDVTKGTSKKQIKEAIKEALDSL